MNTVPADWPLPDGATTPAQATLWRANWRILAAALVLAAFTYAVSSRLPPTYKSTAVVRVTVPGSSANPQGGARAANALASRYAQLVRSPTVLAAISEKTRDPGSELSLALSGGTIRAQNLIAVKATASDAKSARRRADAAAQAVSAYANRLSRTQVTRFRQLADGQLRSIERQIDSERSAAVGYSAQSAAADVPQLAVLSRANLPDRLAPNPLLYALIALLVGPVVVAQFVLVASSRRRT